MNRDHQEEEVKLTLMSEEGLHCLLKHLGKPSKVAEQENEYFDTPEGDLLKERVMLRVRRQEGRVIVTAKSDAQIKVGGLTCREVEFDTTLEVSDQWIQNGLETWDISPVSHALSFAPRQARLVSLGTSAPRRRYFDYSGRGVLEVDRTLLPDGTIHAELELETSRMAEELVTLRKLLDDLGVEYTDQVIPKFQRFLSAREGQQA